jgi:hypothetical protein
MYYTTFHLFVPSCLLKTGEDVLSVAKSRASGPCSVRSIPYPFLIKGSAPYFVFADSPNPVPASDHPFFNAKISNKICYSLSKKMRQKSPGLP